MISFFHSPYLSFSIFSSERGAVRLAQTPPPQLEKRLLFRERRQAKTMPLLSQKSLLVACFHFVSTIRPGRASLK